VGRGGGGGGPECALGHWQVQMPGRASRFSTNFPGRRASPSLGHGLGRRPRRAPQLRRGIEFDGDAPKQVSLSTRIVSRGVGVSGTRSACGTEFERVGASRRRSIHDPGVTRWRAPANDCLLMRGVELLRGFELAARWWRRFGEGPPPSTPQLRIEMARAISPELRTGDRACDGASRTARQ